jgi:hypothetical protein
MEAAATADASAASQPVLAPATSALEGPAGQAQADSTATSAAAQ